MRLLVVRERADGTVEELEHRQIGTRLGEGLHDGGSLAPAAVERSLAAVAEFAAAARARGAHLSCIATSAVRRAADAAAFGERVRALAGVPLEVLPGDVEAAASYRGATYGAPAGARRIAVLDIGGGSTECALGRAGALLAARSIETGSVRVAERFPGLAGGMAGPPAHAAAAAARTAVAAALEPLRAMRPVDELRCVAGTPLTVAAVAFGSHVDDVGGRTLRRSDVDAQLARLLDLTLAQRRVLPGMLPQRADILAAGAVVLSEAMLALGVEAGLLETRDLLLGYLLLERERERARPPSGTARL